MAIKSIYHLIRQQRFLTFLILINAMITAIVICFSYGVYQNYQTMMEVGEQTSKTVTVQAVGDVADTYAAFPEVEGCDMTDEYTSISKGDVVALLAALKDTTKDQIDHVECSVLLTDNVYGLMVYHFFFRPTSEGLVPAGNGELFFSKEDYLNGTRCAVIGGVLTTEHAYHVMVSGMTWKGHYGRIVEIGEELDIGGQKYKVTDRADNYVSALAEDHSIFIPFTSLADDAPLRHKDDTLKIVFKKTVNLGVYNDIVDAATETLTGKGGVVPLDLSALTDLKYINSIIFITVILSLLSAVDLCIIYRYIVESDRRRLVIFRLCGQSRASSVMGYIAQTALLIIPPFIIAQAVFGLFLLPALEDRFTYIRDFFSPPLYAAIFAVYAVTSLICVGAMLLKTVGRRLDFKEKG